MNRLSFITLFLFFSANVFGQNVFPQKINECHLSEFCLDCGDIKANYDTAAFLKVLDYINYSYHFDGSKGQIGFQVLIDSFGKGCVISHTDKTNNNVTKDLVRYLNACKWKPAIEKNKAVNASINIFFIISDCCY